MYILRSHGFLILSQEYRFWIAIPVFVLSKVATILWNLQDLLIILISMGLSSRYCRLNEYTKSLITGRNEPFKHVNSHNYRHKHLWRKLRKAYVHQADLVRALDKHLGPLILLSNINNLYFICLQLYLGIRMTNTDWISRLYYVTSLTWLLFRACSVVLAASEISVQSQHVLPFLRQCSRNTYNIEINRLTNQLTYDNIALSGMGLFSLTRKNLLQVIAAVIKYELILLQFDK
ncbi:unnamed protein product, partial [Iphiclides podalirius]